MPRTTNRNANCPLRKVRLADVPLATRKLHGSYLLKAAREDGDLDLAINLTAEIYTPTGEYWLPAHALDRVHTHE